MYIRARPLLPFSWACSEKNVRTWVWWEVVVAGGGRGGSLKESGGGGDKAMVGISGRASGQAGGP